MSNETIMERYNYAGGYVEIIYLSDSRMYEVWEYISDAYGYDQYFRRRTKQYPEAKTLALDIVQSHDDLTTV